MNVTPYTDLPDWPRDLFLETEEEPTEAALIDYYWMLSSLDDELELIGSPPEPILELQQEVTDFRREIFDLLARAYRLGAQPTETPYFFGFFSRPNRDVLRQLDALEVEKEGVLAELVDFSFGHRKPGLVRLYLHRPPEAETEATRLSVLDTLIGAPTRRACDARPDGAECLSDLEMRALLPCLPTAVEWDPPLGGCPLNAAAN